MKKILCLLLILLLLPTVNISADKIENAKILMEKGEVGDTVKLYLIPPNSENLYASFIELNYDAQVLEYIDSEFLNTSGLSANHSVINNCINIHIEGIITKQICLMVSFKIKSDGDPSLHLTEGYLDNVYNLILERSGNAEWEQIEKNSVIPIDIVSYSEIKIFIRDKYALFAEEHDMSGTILVAVYDENKNLIDFESYTPSKKIFLKPFSKASFVKIMWWDMKSLSPISSAKMIDLR
ncbi:MAG: hypothetical protein IJT38_04380 [Clostridia bacterium]|nr:hypothetical protein [Clostridia bacterium]